MRQVRGLLLALCVAAVGVLGIDATAEPPRGGADEEPIPPPRMTAEEARRRLEAAQAALPEPTVGELKQRIFVRDAQIRRLEAEIAALKEEMQQLRIENEAMKLALETIRDTPIRVQGDGGAAPAADEEKPLIDEPRWTVQYSLGLIEQGGRGVRIVQPTRSGVVVIRDYRNVDRTHVVIRGNFANESLSPWRYTFEIRIGGLPSVAGGSPKIIGSWRYQTPVLVPGEIHQFEVKVPVSHVAQVQTYEVGNIVADNPEMIAPPEPVAPPVEQGP